MSRIEDTARAAERVDVATTHEVAAYRDTPVMKVLGAASEVADQPPLVAWSLVTLALGAAMRRPGLVRTGARMLASHLLATGIKTLVKRSVDRTRPDKAIETGEHRFGAGDSDDHEETAFPSGHAAGAVAIAEAIARNHPRAAVPLRLGAAAIGAIQLPRGKHYGGDVIAGAAIGWAAAWLANAAIDRAERALVAVTRSHA